ncbi:hypothetical protein [Methylobacterium hispanicum]|uniref:hypothetical protein n=1 Tax=Methylobacterium hispanicum TaxID=270350 RepID=UPI002F35BFFB
MVLRQHVEARLAVIPARVHCHHDEAAIEDLVEIGEIDRAPIQVQRTLRIVPDRALVLTHGRCIGPRRLLRAAERPPALRTAWMSTLPDRPEARNRMPENDRRARFNPEFHEQN